jgi:integrase
MTSPASEPPELGIFKTVKDFSDDRLHPAGRRRARRSLFFPRCASSIVAHKRLWTFISIPNTEACMARLMLTPALIAERLKCPPGTDKIEYCDLKERGLVLECRSAVTSVPTWYWRRKVDGKLKRNKIGTTKDLSLDDARKRVALMKAEHALGLRAEKQELEQGITLDRFWREHYLPHADYKRSLGRDKQIYSRIKPEFGHVPMKNIKRVEVDQFKRKLVAEGLSPATVNQHLQLMRRFMNLGVEFEFLERNVLTRIKMMHLDNRREAFLNDAQVDDLVQVLQTDDNRLVCMIILFLLSTGARLNEALCARWDHIDMEQALWMIPASNSKSKRMKHLPLSDSALWALKAVTKREDSPYVFASPVTGKPFTGISRTWYKLRRKAGLPTNFRIHDLRHSFASRLVSKGQSLYVVQQMLGHADPRTTMRYAHLSMDTQRQAANLVSIQMPKRA